MRNALIISVLFFIACGKSVPQPTIHAEFSNSANRKMVGGIVQNDSDIGVVWQEFGHSSNQVIDSNIVVPHSAKAIFLNTDEEGIHWLCAASHLDPNIHLQFNINNKIYTEKNLIPYPLKGGGCLALLRL